MICIGYNANAIDSQGERLLSLAISFGDPKVVEAVIEGGAEINTTTNINSSETMLLNSKFLQKIRQQNQKQNQKQN